MEFQRRTYHAMLWLSLLPLGAVSALRAKKEDGRLNFVWFFPDTLRAESVSSYGLPLNTTPHLDAFAKTAVRFEQAHVLHTQCAPSRVAMLTGRYMHTVGHRTQFSLIQPGEFNYFRVMKDHGYHIQYYGKNDLFSTDAFPLSVSSWMTTGGGMPGGSQYYQMGEAGYYSMLMTGSEAEYNSTGGNGDFFGIVEAVKWLKSDPPQPFVLFVPSMGAHPPYGAPKHFNNMWSVETVMENIKLRPPYLPNKPKYHSEVKGIPFYRNLTALSATEFARIQATYLGMVSYIDWMFGVLLNGVQQAGLEDNTVIIVSSDHGDFAGDYNMVEKWPGGADDILTRVPLFMRVPGAQDSARGFVSHAPVSSMDIPHTMCELAGINVSDMTRFPVNFGVSLKEQVVDGIEGDMARFVYSEGGFSHPDEVFPGGSDHVPNNTGHLYYPRAMEEMSDGGHGSPRWMMIRNLTHKFVYRERDVSELYDYTTDPQELNNLIDRSDHHRLRKDLKWRLMAWMLHTSDVSPLVYDPRKLPSPGYVASGCASNSFIERPEPLDHLELFARHPDVHNMVNERGTYQASM